MNNTRKLLLAGFILAVAQTPAAVEATQDCVQGQQVNLCGVWMHCENPEDDIKACDDPSAPGCYIVSNCPEILEPFQVCC
jgi:hypothetical protein